MVIDDIQDLFPSFVEFSVSHVKRQGNVVAHFVVKLCMYLCKDVDLFEDFPYCILSLASAELYYLSPFYKKSKWIYNTGMEEIHN